MPVTRHGERTSCASLESPMFETERRTRFSGQFLAFGQECYGAEAAVDVPILRINDPSDGKHRSCPVELAGLVQWSEGYSCRPHPAAQRSGMPEAAIPPSPAAATRRAAVTLLLRASAGGKQVEGRGTRFHSSKKAAALVGDGADPHFKAHRGETQRLDGQLLLGRRVVRLMLPVQTHDSLVDDRRKAADVVALQRWTTWLQTHRAPVQRRYCQMLR
ncbi:hypothetical protein SAMN04488020_11531 [Palleronia marisminoris]|uniref:Uncharacterized protein n=1 Tax=Palleronia marisminoris TaxID=315423 RepID=A0A1Y5TNE9_9RHOB|nr:hypothetical protein SAMN04488020_11531 [Palleronia marisminoris]SLN68092.1 hypothetical protein PAM7066_03427 [Palleronia marisminoris]